MRIYYLEIYVPRRKTTKLTFPATNWIVYFRKYRYLTLIIKYIIIIFSQSDLKGILNLFPPHQQRQESFNTKVGTEDKLKNKNILRYDGGILQVVTGGDGR